jgi:hypothetical protein
VSNCGEKSIRQVLINPKGYSLNSDLRRFELTAFGYALTKYIDDEGNVQWLLPCGLTDGWSEHPRLPDEGLFCYFKRLFEEGLLVPGEGSTGPQGPASTVPGFNGWTAIEIEFTPPSGSESFIFTVTDAIDDVAPNRILFVEGLGWIQVSGVTGVDIVAAVVIQYIDSPLTTIPVGSLVVPVGPAGPPGDVALVVATPTFLFTDVSLLTISCVTPEAVIYYTLDGSEPTEASDVYTVPFSPAQSSVAVTVKAKGFKPGYLDSATAEVAPIYGIYGSSFSDTITQADFNTGPIPMWMQTPDQYASAVQSYHYDSALEVGGWKFYGVQDGELAPAVVDGFFISAGLSPSDFASTGDFSFTDANGWPYAEVVVDNDSSSMPYGTYRVYRLLLEVDDAFDMTVQQL